ncbi:MAG: protein translocase subunit SecF [Arenicellales bacterium]
MEFIKKATRIDFLGKRYICFAMSGTLIMIGIVSMIIQGLNFGIDFTGGTVVEVAYDQPVEIAKARDLLRKGNINDAQVQYYGSSSELLVRLPGTAQGKKSDELSNDVMQALRKPYDEVVVPGTEQSDTQQCVTPGGSRSPCRVQMRRVEFVGPQVGQQLTQQGGLAMMYALIMILVYVAWRFEWRLSVGAVAALVHDVLITIGVFSVFQLDFSLNVLAAVLAVIGYSLNDTIVVFDRIRENFRRMRKGSTIEIMNAALNQTLSRTTLTSGTVLLVLIALLTLGGDAIWGFALALVIGVVVGTYSSIYVASAIALHLGVSKEDLAVPVKEGAEQKRSQP